MHPVNTVLYRFGVMLQWAFRPEHDLRSFRYVLDPIPEQLRDRAARIMNRMGGLPRISVPLEQQADPSAPDGRYF